MPDLFQIPLYLRVGKEHHRSFWISHDRDWRGFRNIHPFWSDLWEIPHSLFFLLFIIAPIVLYFHLPTIAILAYLFHIIIDVYTHKGEWNLKLFYPFNFKFNGFTNAWAWSWSRMAASWAILICIIAAIELVRA